MAEFDLIDDYFSRLTSPGSDVVLGIGDDCALLTPRTGRQLAMTMDTLIAGRHFFPDADPVSLGYKSLAVNLSDLAAMGAEPAWALLSLSLPAEDHAWLQGFSEGFKGLAETYEVSLVGGDTCEGPLSITVQLSGYVGAGKSMLRSGARVGERIYVSGKLGDAALALKMMRQGVDPGVMRQSLERPQPRIAEGRLLSAAGVRTCIDISDGLVADLGHICERSACAARVHLEALPLSAQVKAWVESNDDWRPVIAGGDDYELCFTAPEALGKHLQDTGINITCIGEIIAGEGVQMLKPDGSHLPVPRAWEHFAS